jgi:predicted nucleic acid-binding protein
MAPTPPRLFLDSSVLIAAMASESGASRVILVLAEVGLVKLVACPYVLQEVERNLSKKLPALLPIYHQLLDHLQFEMVTNPSLAEVQRWAAIIVPKDAPVLAAAVAANPHRLVTLDTRDFLSDPQVADHSGLVICTPGDLIQQVRSLLAGGLS